MSKSLADPFMADVKQRDESSEDFEQQALNNLPFRRAVLSASKKYGISVLTAASLVGSKALLPLMQCKLLNRSVDDRLLHDANRALLAAVSNDCPKSIEALILGGGADPFEFIDGATATHMAAAQGKCKALAAILQLDDIREATFAMDSFGMSPVHVAALCGQVDAVRLLVHHDERALVVKVPLFFERYKHKGKYKLGDQLSSLDGYIFQRGNVVFGNKLSPYGECENSISRFFGFDGCSVAHTAAVGCHASVLQEIARLSMIAELDWRGRCGSDNGDSNPQNSRWQRAACSDRKRKLATCSGDGVNRDYAGKSVLELLQRRTLQLREQRNIKSKVPSIDLEEISKSALQYIIDKAVHGVNHSCTSRLFSESEMPRVTLENVLEARDSGFSTPFHTACKFGNANVVQCLVRLGANVHAKGLYNSSAVHEAAINDDTAVLDGLVKEHNLDVDELDAHGDSALKYLSLIGSESGRGIKKLVELGADCNFRSYTNTTPLFAAACFGNGASCRELLYAGANPDVLCGFEDPHSPLQSLRRNGHIHVLLEWFDLAATDSTLRSLIVHYRDSIPAVMVGCIKDFSSDSAAEELVTRAGLVNEIWDKHRSVLQLALRYRLKLDVNTACLLLEAGTNVNHSDSRGWTILHYAARHNRNFKLVKSLVKRGADVNASFEPADFVTPLQVAVEGNCTDIVQVLLSYGANCDMAKCQQMHAPLHRAGSFDCLEAARLLVAAGSDVQARDIQGKTPLHAAADRNSIRMVMFLIDAGCAVDLRCNEQKTALHAAVAQTAFASKAKGVLQVLLSRGANANAIDNAGNSPLHYAAACGSEAAVQMLIDSGADVHGRNANGYTPLHNAAISGHAKIVSVLLNLGADLDSRSKSGKTALHLCVENGHPRVAKYLLRCGADIRAVDENGTCAIDYAISAGRGAIFGMLLEMDGLESIAERAIFVSHSPSASGDAVCETEISSETQRQDGDEYCEWESARARCSICRLVLRSGAEIWRLLCGHMFHDECIFGWLTSPNGRQQMSCPLCRKSIGRELENAVGSGSADAPLGEDSVSDLALS